MTGESEARVAPALEEAYANFDLRAEHPAARKPSVHFAFDFPALLRAFERVDEEANQHKARSRQIGMTAIVLVLIALLIAASEPLLAALGKEASHIAGYAAAILAILGTGIGLTSLLPGSDRRKWLHNRLQAESLRLLHFGFIAARLPQLAEASGKGAEETRYIDERASTLARLLAEMAAQTPKAAHEAVQELRRGIFASAKVEDAPVHGEQISPAAADAFIAWRELRLTRQLAYCDAKLEAGLKAGALNPLRQEKIFSLAGWLCIGAVVLLHLLHLTDSWLHTPTVWLQVAVVWAALITLALRALEDGLQSEREVERYEQYRANIVVALERFDGGATMAAKVETMRAFERMGLEEMRVFLRTHAKSHFLL